MHPTSKKQAVRHALYRLGLHTTSKGIVDALSQKGISVKEELVREVRIKLLKEATDERPAKAPRPAAPAVRRRPQRFPGRNRR